MGSVSNTTHENQALIALGYSDKEAVSALKQVPSDTTVSDGIRLALKTLSKA